MSEQPAERPVKELDDHPHPAGDEKFAADETLGIDNTDTAMSPEDATTPAE